MYTLRRIPDGAGDSGNMSMAIQYDEKGRGKANMGHIPIIGCGLMVGSTATRSYQDQDYWTTTLVTEILEHIKTETGEYFKFKTLNSVYEWWTGTKPQETIPIKNQESLFQNWIEKMLEIISYLLTILSLISGIIWRTTGPLYISVILIIGAVILAIISYIRNKQ